MKRAMTTKKALKITAEQYRWLADNPKAHPSDWAGWDKYGYALSIMSKDRDPLCEVAAGNCMDCPLIALWIKDGGTLPKEQRLKSCLVNTSPYMVRTNHRHSIREEDKEAALEASIAIFTEAEYAIKNGIREPDLSIYRAKRTRRMRGSQEEESDEVERPLRRRKKVERARCLTRRKR